MKIARVTGTVISTIHHPVRDGTRLLICQWLNPNMEPEGGYTLAIDAVGAGVDQVVLILDEGNSSRQIMTDDTAPIRTMVVGVVDAVEMA